MPTTSNSQRRRTLRSGGRSGGGSGGKLVSRKNKTRNRKRKALNVLVTGGKFVTKATVAAAKKKVESEIDILN